MEGFEKLKYTGQFFISESPVIGNLELSGSKSSLYLWSYNEEDFCGDDLLGNQKQGRTVGRPG